IGEASHHVLTVAGTGMLTANNGTLTLSVQGTINQATGAIDVSGHVVGGTGLFAHATGQLMFVGVEDLTNGSFANTITGTVCLAHGGLRASSGPKHDITAPPDGQSGGGPPFRAVRRFGSRASPLNHVARAYDPRMCLHSGRSSSPGLGTGVRVA